MMFMRGTAGYIPRDIKRNEDKKQEIKIQFFREYQLQWKYNEHQIAHHRISEIMFFSPLHKT
jgi:hypothetical protein